MNARREFASTSSPLFLITPGTSALLVTLCVFESTSATNASGYSAQPVHVRGHDQAQQRPRSHRRREHQPPATAGPVDQRAEHGRDERERREGEQQVQQHLRAGPGCVVALKNRVSASDTVTNTSPATPIAYASASRANGGNVVDSSLGRAFVVTTYPAASLPARPGPRPLGRGR